MSAFKSPYSLYSEEFATFGEDEVYDHKDAEGFINLFGLPLKVRALALKDKKKSDPLSFSAIAKTGTPCGIPVLFLWGAYENWLLYSAAYTPPVFISSSCVPCSTRSPSFKTRIRSASKMVDSLWAIWKLVRPPSAFSSRPSSAFLRTRVDGACRFVQNQYLRICAERARDRKQLLLPGGKIPRALVNHGIVAFRQVPDEIIGVCHPARLLHLFVRRFRPPVTDIVANAGRIQPRILQHHPKQAAHILARHVSSVCPVDPDRPPLRS